MGGANNRGASGAGGGQFFGGNRGGYGGNRTSGGFNKNATATRYVNDKFVSQHMVLVIFVKACLYYPTAFYNYKLISCLTGILITCIVLKKKILVFFVFSVSLKRKK